MYKIAVDEKGKAQHSSNIIAKHKSYNKAPHNNHLSQLDGLLQIKKLIIQVSRDKIYKTKKKLYAPDNIQHKIAAPLQLQQVLYPDKCNTIPVEIKRLPTRPKKIL